MASLFEDLNSTDSEYDADYEPNESSDDEEPNPATCSTDEELEATQKKATDVCESDKMDEKEKEKANAVYENFLKEVESEMIEREGDCTSSLVASSTATSLALKPGSSTSSSVVSSDVKSEKKISSEISFEEPAKVVEFAGEKISVAKDGTILSSDSSQSSTAAKVNPAAAPVKRKGLQSVLGIIQNKKAKVSTLQKSALDWKTFKKEAGISEELERFNKGKGGYIERKRFLERSDVRSFEIERDIRQSRVKKS